MGAIEGMQNAGKESNNPLTYIAGAPTRVVGNILNGFRGVNFKTDGLMQGVLKAGLVVPTQVGKEVLFTPIGAAGRVLNGTRKAAMSVLGATGAIAFHGAMDTIRVPVGFDPRNLSPSRLPRIESALDAGQSLRQAMDSTRRPGSEPRPQAQNPDNQPRT